MTNDDLTNDEINALRDGMRVDFWMHPRDREIIERIKERYGCTTTAAIRACIRIADEVKLKLEHHPPNNAE